jgi:hypothetical protein
MRKALVVLTLALAAATASAQTQTPTHPTGITFSVGQSSNDFSFRRLFGTQWAGLATLGYGHGTSFAVVSSGENASVPTDSWSLGLSGRRYFAPADLRPFAEVGVGERWTEISGCPHIRSPFASASGGVEYHIAPRVSIEGSAGLSYSQFEQRCNFNGFPTSFSQHSLSTFRSALSVTFYF